MTLMNWTFGALATASVLLFARAFGLKIIEVTVSFILSTLNPGVVRGSKKVSGPTWQFPNGLLIERFINGRSASDKWREQYGSVYRSWLGPYPEIVITTPEDFKIFSSDAISHAKPHNFNMGWYFGELLGQCLGLHNGKEWKRIRHVFEPAYTQKAASTHVGDISRAAKKYVEALPSLAEKSTGYTEAKQDDGDFHLQVQKGFVKFPYFRSASIIYGPMTKDEEDELWSLTEERNTLNIYMFIGGPYWFRSAAGFFDNKALQRLHDFKRKWRDYNVRAFAARRARGEKPPIVSYFDEIEAGNLTLEEMDQTLDELLMVNLDAISHVLGWLITLLADHADMRRELQDEIKTNGDDLDAYIAKAETHLHRCLYESIRIRPFSIFTMGEISTETKNFGGVLVKPGTQVVLDVLAINVRNPFWGSDSETFKPSRMKGIKPSDLRYNLHTWGIGSRKCMGQYVATHIIKALTVHLYDHYDVVIADERSQKDEKFSWTPKADATLRLTKRQ